MDSYLLVPLTHTYELNETDFSAFISDTLTHMVGSYPPKETPHSFTTPEEDIPHGTLARGTYTVHSLFTDDDKNEHLKV